VYEPLVRIQYRNVTLAVIVTAIIASVALCLLSESVAAPKQAHASDQSRRVNHSGK
jgi:hypothetical protein